MLETVFFGSILLVFYAYFGYALSLLIMSMFKKKVVKKAPHFPEATLIITAYNEEKRIREKLENTLAVDYPKDKLQILVTSDGSTDKTHDIVKGFEKDGVELLVIKDRGGKENAQKEAVKHARGKIIIFSDVATELDPEGIKEVVANFADPSVGCISSEDRLIGKNGKPCGEGVYVCYEMWLRRLESRVNSLVGLSGSFFAARKDVCRDFSGEMQSDFRTLLNSKRLGYRGVSDPSAIGYYLDIAEGDKEFERKIRTVIRGLTVFFNNLEFLNPIKYGFFSYQYFCHKLLRWMVPFFLLTAFVTNGVLAMDFSGYYYLFLFHSLFYALGLWGMQAKSFSGNRLLIKIPMYFLTVNAAIVVGWWRYLKGQRMVMWTPSAR